MLSLFVLLAGTAQAAEPAYLALIIDDLGQNRREAQALIALPAPVSGAILPHAPHSQAIAEELHHHGRDVLLHLPMQPIEPRAAGPGALTLGMSARELAITVDYDLTTVPHAIGINNHMGSLLTQDLPTMRSLMRHLGRHGQLFFLDSMTSAQSVARAAAREHAVPFLARDVFLDSDRAPDAIRAQLNRAAALARRSGAAIAIGHPYPETLAVLREWLVNPGAHEVELISVSRLLRIQTARAASPEG